MHALTVFIAATPDEMRAALPTWSSKPRPPSKRIPEAGVAVISGSGSYEEHLESTLPGAVTTLRHAVLKNVMLRHLTAVCWAAGVELLSMPPPFLVPPDGDTATLHALPPAAMQRIASASDTQLDVVARKLSRAAAFTDVGWGVHEARALLKDIRPIATALGIADDSAQRLPFALQLV